MAREAVAGELFMASLAPEQRTRIRQEGFTGFRRSAAEFILGTVCAAIQGAGKSANARLVAAAIRDTREVWASFLLPQDRARVIEQLADLPRWAPDETARTDLAAFTAALRAVNCSVIPGPRRQRCGLVRRRRSESDPDHKVSPVLALWRRLVSQPA